MNSLAVADQRHRADLGQRDECSSGQRSSSPRNPHAWRPQCRADHSRRLSEAATVNGRRERGRRREDARRMIGLSLSVFLSVFYAVPIRIRIVHD